MARQKFRKGDKVTINNQGGEDGVIIHRCPKMGEDKQFYLVDVGPGIMQSDVDEERMELIEEKETVVVTINFQVEPGKGAETFVAWANQLNNRGGAKITDNESFMTSRSTGTVTSVWRGGAK